MFWDIHIECCRYKVLEYFIGEDEPNQDKSDTADAEMTEKQQCDDSSQTVIDYSSSGEYSVLL